MNRKDVIEVLKMENDLITFDPATGEDIDVSCLNDLNKKCYIAHEQAIEFLKQSIPIEWIKKWCNEHNRKSLEERLLKRYGVITMLEDWDKENENI